MREFHIRVPASERDALAEVLDERGVEYTTISDDDGLHVFFPLPTAAVAPVLDELQAAGVSSHDYTVMSKAEYVQTGDFEALQERYTASLRKLSKRELHSKIREMQWPRELYYLGTVLSVVAACAGLLIDQPALVIGAMIIAPQASSALAAPAGILLGDWGLFTGSVKEQVLSLGLAIVGASAFAWLVKVGGFVPSDLPVTEIELVSVRLAPTMLSTVAAVIAGVVGALGYTTEQSTSLIGVMITAALIPAAAAVGLAVAWAAPLLGLGALLLLLVNVISINVGVYLTLRTLGYRPAWRLEGPSSFRASVPSARRTAVHAGVAFILVAAVVTAGLTATSVVFARDVTQAVEETTSAPAYDSLSVSSVQTGYGGPSWTTVPADVTVAVTRPPGASYPRLSERLERRIEQRTGRDVQVTVRYLTASTSSAESSQAGPPLPGDSPRRSTPAPLSVPSVRPGE